MTERDQGLQAERTAMAWQRTALGIGAVSALLLHHGGERLAIAAPGALGLLAALALLVVVEARYERTVRRVAAGDSPMGPRLVRSTAYGTVLLALAAATAVVWAGS